MNLLAMPLMGLQIVYLWVYGLIIMIRHPIRWTRFVRAYRETESNLVDLEVTAEYRKLPRSQRRLIERNADRQTKKAVRGLCR